MDIVLVGDTHQEYLLYAPVGGIECSTKCLIRIKVGMKSFEHTSCGRGHFHPDVFHTCIEVGYRNFKVL